MGRRVNVMWKRRSERQDAFHEEQRAVLLFRRAIVGLDQLAAQPLHHWNDFVVDGGGGEQIAARRCSSLQLFGFVL